MFAAFPVTSAEIISGKAVVTDGDSIKIDGDSIRLGDIDAPEIKQRCLNGSMSYMCGVESKKALVEIVQDKLVRCEISGADRYGRLLATCFVGKQNINATMVQRGWALSYRRYSARYVAKEQEAITLQQGIHAGLFMMPWEWRKACRNTR